MHFITAATALLYMAGTALAAKVSIKSHCDQDIYVIVSNSTTASAQITIAANGTYSQPLAGVGNQFGISKDPDYYTTSTKKFVFGFSDDVKTVTTYWSVSSVDGDAFEGGPGVGGFHIVPSEPTCTEATTYDGQIHTCTDTASLTVNLC